MRRCCYVVLRCSTYVMLRCCYVLLHCSLALYHIRHATLLLCSLAFYHIRHATLLLCSLALFPCTVAHTSCYAAAMFWKPKMPNIQTAWIKRFCSMFECSSSGVGKTQIAATWASSRPPRTWSTLCEEKNARRCCFIQNHFKMGSQNFKKFLTSKHMKMT